jgi:hypothetical protein
MQTASQFILWIQNSQRRNVEWKMQRLMESNGCSIFQIATQPTHVNEKE